ncbi:MAG TPA: GAF domain-containing protein [Solirubrobacteraceae bacterium]|nr:GAF domain-containing protein [Solirubrobacteraceae bacterium]
MTMRATTVRFSEDLWELLELEAERDGVSAAQFVRDSTLLRIGMLAGRRGDAAVQTSVQELAQHTRRRARSAPADNVRRVRALRATGLLDSPPTEAFDRLTELVRRVLAVPVALISLVDEDRQFFKSQAGLVEPWASQRETPLSHSFCQYAVRSREPLVIPDAREHPVLKDNLAVPDLGVVAYAGVPLITDEGYALGSLCAIDTRPRFWTGEQIGLLTDLARLTVTEIKVASGVRAA